MRKTAILFVHGYMGCSKQFTALMNRLQLDPPIDQYNIVLPGHEKTLKEFLTSDRFSWQAYVDNKINELRKQYENLILVGHSMGGLLLINSAIACPDSIQTIIAISLPLYIKITIKSIQIRLCCLGKATKSETKWVSAAREMSGVSGVTFANSYRLLPNTLGLLKIMKIVRGKLNKLAVPLTVINSKGDELVSLKTVDFVKRVYPKAKVFLLKDSTHFWFSPDEIESIALEVSSECNNFS